MLRSAGAPWTIMNCEFPYGLRETWIEVVGHGDAIFSCAAPHHLVVGSLRNQRLMVRANLVLGFQATVIVAAALPAAKGEAFVALEGEGAIALQVPPSLQAMTLHGASSTLVQATHLQGWLNPLAVHESITVEHQASSLFQVFGQGTILVGRTETL